MPRPSDCDFVALYRDDGGMAVDLETGGEGGAGGPKVLEGEEQEEDCNDGPEEEGEEVRRQRTMTEASIKVCSCMWGVSRSSRYCFVWKLW